VRRYRYWQAFFGVMLTNVRRRFLVGAKPSLTPQEYSSTGDVSNPGDAPFEKREHEVCTRVSMTGVFPVPGLKIEVEKTSVDCRS
jgi:hypothetical protein